MNAVEAHPQRKFIEEQILSGAKLTAIAAQIEPSLHISTLSRYRTNRVAPAVRAMNPRSVNTRNMKVLATTSRTDVGAVVLPPPPGQSVVHVSKETAATHGLRQRLEKMVDARIERRSSWIKEAESSQRLDADGNSYTIMDHRALAAHDGNEGKDIETLAKLGGIYAEATSETTIKAVVMMPGSPSGRPGVVLEQDGSLAPQQPAGEVMLGLEISVTK